MKHIFLNLKRFDVPRELGGVNSIADIRDWGGYIIKNTQERLRRYSREDVDFTMFFPEMHLMGAMDARNEDSPVEIGCQSVFWMDVEPGGNFGAFTTARPAAAMAAVGCSFAIIGHCEERNFLTGVVKEGEGADTNAVNRILNRKVKNAISRGMKVLYCIGETGKEQENWQEVLEKQLEIGIQGVDPSRIVIAYEPVWSIGPGKTPAGKDYISMVAKFVKEKTNGMDVVYGGGLKQDNAGMLASIDEIDGGLIALTRFQGEIGFYPDEYLDIIEQYMSAVAV